MSLVDKKDDVVVIVHTAPDPTVVIYSHLGLKTAAIAMAGTPDHPEPYVSMFEMDSSGDMVSVAVKQC